MNNKEILISARTLIINPKNWMTGTHATNKDGDYACFPSDPEAACFCAFGALDRLGRTDLYYSHLENAAEVLYGTRDVARHVNDHLGHEAVIKMYDFAIDHCEEGESA